MNRNRKNVLKHIEEELENYKDTKKEIERLKKEPIQTSKIQHKIDHMTRITSAIEFTYTKLADDKKRLVEIRYWTHSHHYNWDGLALSLNISKRQAIRWRNEIVSMISERVGWH